MGARIGVYRRLEAPVLAMNANPRHAEPLSESFVCDQSAET